MNVSVKIYPWEPVKIFELGNFDLKMGDLVIVETEQGIESGEVVELDIKSDGDKEKQGSILRRANTSDLQLIKRYKARKSEALEACRVEIKKNNLPMKLMDTHFSFDGSKIIFPFTSERRVDFREVVRNLSKRFQKSIRLQQVGSRDEARAEGGFGICGRELCCNKLGLGGNLKSVTAESVRVQQMGQRGSDRLSGLCGRLRCCLAYEVEQYRELSVGFPNLRAKVKVNGKEGIVVEKHILSREVTVEFKDRVKKRVAVEEVG